MSVRNTDLSALISTRICHDLINPIGAISNGLELLAEMSGTASPEMALVTDSAARANAKLGYFRIAFGSAAPDTEIGLPVITRIVSAMFADGRFRLDWQVSDDPLPRAETKLALLLILAVEQSLKIGGVCTVTRQNGAWHLDATGPRVEPGPDLWRVVTDNVLPSELASSEVQYAVAATTARVLGRSVSLESGAAGMMVRF